MRWQSNPLLVVEHLTMRFGGLVAVNDLTFQVGRGDITALIGPNGAGKTTVFNCVTGFYKPTEGRLALARVGAASTAEVEAGEHYLERIAETLRADGIEVETAIVHAPRPGSQIVRYALEVQPDLIIMGAHGHRRLKDLIFGNTINPVRHELRVPLLIVRK